MRSKRGFRRVQRIPKAKEEPTYTVNAPPRLREKEAGTGIPVITFLNVRYSFPDINTARRIQKILEDAHASHDMKTLGKALAVAKPFKTGFKADPARKNTNRPVIERLLEMGKVTSRTLKARQENERAMLEEMAKHEEAKTRKTRKI